MDGHEIQPGVIPTNFRVTRDGKGGRPVAGFGNRAISRVAPADTMMRRMVLLHAYVQVTEDSERTGHP